MIDATKITFRPHHKHNSACDVLHYQIDKDTSITYCIYVEQIKPTYATDELFPAIGTELMEYYRGANYNVGSSEKSYSKIYRINKEHHRSLRGQGIPKEYRNMWLELKEMYQHMAPISDLII